MQRTFDVDIKEFTADERMEPGLLSCQGCGAALAMKLALKGLGPRTAAVIPACCWAVIVGVWPHSALRIPVLHAPFASAAAAAAGVRAAYDALGEKDVTVMAWAGDGGTYDIGLQALSGAAERDENILYVCYDNEAYMNTGIQRSGATPIGAWTTTTPRGAVKEEFKKNIEAIMLAHNIPYFATANVAYPDDFIHKFKKAREIEGTCFIRVFAPCPPGWRIDVSQTVRIARLATLAKVFPLYEVDKGRYTITHYPEREIPVKDYVSPQGRFQMSEDVLARSQTLIDRKWRQLQRMVNEDYAKQIWSVWRA